MLVKKIGIAALSVLLVLALIGCAAREGDNTSVLESDTAPSSEQPQPESDNPPEEQEPEAENPTQEDTPLRDFADELRSTWSDELVSKLNELLDQHRNGTFVEVLNHHPPYPADFPPVNELPHIDNIEEISIAWKETVFLDAATEIGGIIWVIVPIDKSHIYALTPAMYADVDDHVSVGFGNSSFVAMSVEEFISQDELLSYSGE